MEWMRELVRLKFFLIDIVYFLSLAYGEKEVKGVKIPILGIKRGKVSVCYGKKRVIIIIWLKKLKKNILIIRVKNLVFGIKILTASL